MIVPAKVANIVWADSRLIPWIQFYEGGGASICNTHWDKACLKVLLQEKFFDQRINCLTALATEAVMGLIREK